MGGAHGVRAKQNRCRDARSHLEPSPVVDGAAGGGPSSSIVDTRPRCPESNPCSISERSLSILGGGARAAERGKRNQPDDVTSDEERHERIANAVTVDVEDWFHILDARGAPDRSAWESLPSRVEANLDQLLELFGRFGVRATLFWLGWEAEHFPSLVRRCQTEGHEIASHGYGHLLAYQVGRKTFGEDARRAKAVLEGSPGHRSRGSFHRHPRDCLKRHQVWGESKPVPMEMIFFTTFRCPHGSGPSVFPGATPFPGVKITVAGLTRSTPAFQVDVIPLPEAVETSAAVGYFSLKADWNEGPYRVGDIVSVRVRVDGEGNLNVLKLPVPDL